MMILIAIVFSNQMWFRDLSPMLLDGVDLQAVRFTTPDVAQVLEAALGVDECNTCVRACVRYCICASSSSSSSLLLF
jgi:hypothetical protein